MMVKYYKPILGDLGKPVHELMVQEAIKLLPEKIQDLLEEKIKAEKIPAIAGIDVNGKWRIIKRFENPKSLAELIIQGSRAEDQSYSAKKYYVDDSPINSVLGISVPSLAHYWCYEEYVNSGKNIGLLPEEKVKTPYWWLPGIGVFVKRILQSLSKHKIPYQSALSRATIYWNSDIKYKRKMIKNPKVKAQTYLLLGRVLHLLTDVGVPAHSHCDTHFPWFDPDSLEFQVGFWMNEKEQKWKAEEDQKAIFNDKWTRITTFFTKFAEISTLFDSDDVDGKGEGRPYRWGKECRLGISGYMNKHALRSIADVIVPLNFQFIAGMIFMFFKQFFPTIWKQNKDEFLKRTTSNINF
jgi:hypothetical protein